MRIIDEFWVFLDRKTQLNTSSKSHESFVEKLIITISQD